MGIPVGIDGNPAVVGNLGCGRDLEDVDVGIGIGGIGIGNDARLFGKLLAAAANSGPVGKFGNSNCGI